MALENSCQSVDMGNNGRKNLFSPDAIKNEPSKPAGMDAVGSENQPLSLRPWNANLASLTLLHSGPWWIEQTELSVGKPGVKTQTGPALPSALSQP